MTTPRGMYTIKEAAERCGYSRANTFREKFLSTPEGRSELGAAYDWRGRLVVSQRAVEALKKRVDAERASRGNWRVKNLGDWARPSRGGESRGDEAAEQP